MDRRGLWEPFRVYLRTHPSLLKAIARKRPHGPLATSYVRHRGKKKTECRYDFIFVPDMVKVVEVEYLYEEGVREGSDHALVVARMEL